MLLRSTREGPRVNMGLLLERDSTVRKPHHHRQSPVDWPMSGETPSISLASFTIADIVSLATTLSTSHATRRRNDAFEVLLP